MPAIATDLTQQHRDRRTLTAPLTGNASIAVLGVDRARTHSHIAALLAQTLVAYQGSSVLAMDADIPTSTLRPWLTGHTRDSLNQILTGLGVRHRGPTPDQPVTYQWLESRLTPGSDVPLLAVDPSSPGPVLRSHDYSVGLQRLHRWWPLILSDLPMPSPSNVSAQAVMDADRVVLVAEQSAHDSTALRQAWQWVCATLGNQQAADRVVIAQPTSSVRAKPLHHDVVGATVDIVPVPGINTQQTPSPAVLAQSKEQTLLAAQHLAAVCLAPLVTRGSRNQKPQTQAAA